MNPTVSDWVSTDSSQNITLSNANQFQNQLASAFAIQFADMFVRTSGDNVTVEQVRQDPVLSNAPVNFWGILAGVAPVPFNVATLHASVTDAAQSSDPVANLENILQQALPQTDVQSIILRAPVIRAAVQNAISKIQ